MNNCTAITSAVLLACFSSTTAAETTSQLDEMMFSTARQYRSCIEATALFYDDGQADASKLIDSVIPACREQRRIFFRLVEANYAKANKQDDNFDSSVSAKIANRVTMALEKQWEKEVVETVLKSRISQKETNAKNK